jgi:hypothetical protein
MNYERAFKRAMTGLAILAGITPTIFNVGKDIGYNQGFEHTKTYIRRDASNVWENIVRLENISENEWWQSNDTTQINLKRAYRMEKDAYQECYLKIDDFINYRIAPLTAKDVKRSAELDKIYDFK